MSRSLGSSLARLLGPMLGLMETMVKAARAGGPGMQELGMEKLKSQVREA